jgi:CRISPR-associated protein Csd2
MSETIQHRYDFVYFFDVADGNPNGDPDAGNMPRVDPETSQGLVTDVCLKRKIRNFVAVTKANQNGYDIYVRERAVLNQFHEWAYEEEDLKPESKKLPKKAEDAERLTKRMCKNFFDIRTFGAVMTTEINCGQVRGPVQFTFARSIDPIAPAEFSITRCAVTNERDLEKERTMGRKFTVPYAPYRCHGFINPTLAEKTGFIADDLDLLKCALNNMFEMDHSAARGHMAPVRCVAFRHDNKLGNARADELFSLVTVEKRPELKAENRPARSRVDYTIAVSDRLPDGVTVEEWVETHYLTVRA